jgi:hypothetical protein
VKLSDGTVISSAFGTTGKSDYSQGFGSIRKSDKLKIGTIIAVRTVDSTDGIQKSANNSSEGQTGSAYETVYDVRIDDQNARPFIFNGCRALKPFMGANNYFDMIHESADLNTLYTESDPTGIGGVFASPSFSLVGSRCVVLCVENEPTAGVILGFLQHPARKSKITKDKELHMEMEFNGLNISIDKDGAFKIEANGPFIPTVAPPAVPVPEGILRANPIAGPFTIEITKDMQFRLQDNLGQMISVDRQAMEMEITNGTESIKLIKSLIPIQGQMLINVGGEMTVAANSGVYGFTKSLELSTLDFQIVADKSMSVKTANAEFTADLGFKVDAMQIAHKAKTTYEVEATTLKLKGAAGELLALIYEMIDGMSKLTIASPTGPCAPLNAAPQWAPVMAALIKLKTITGS